MLGLVGYVFSFGFFFSALAKPFYPENIGLWLAVGVLYVNQHDVRDCGVVGHGDDITNRYF